MQDSIEEGIQHCQWCLSKRPGQEIENAPEAIRQWLVSAVTETADGLWWWKIGTNECWFSNRLKDMLGITNDELDGVYCHRSDIVHPDDVTRILKNAREHQVSGTPCLVELRLLTSNGYRWFEARGVTMSNEQGEQHFTGAIRDITTRRQTEQALENARDEAVQASRLKTEFLANISHEIRTPLNGVIGMTNMLLSTNLNVEQRHYARTIREAGQSLLSIINDILDLSILEAGQLRIESSDFDPATVVESVAQLLAPHAHAKGVVLIIHLSPKLPKLATGDEERLRQILFNLASNAVKYTEKGHVRIFATAEVSASKATLNIIVDDTGDGINDADMSKLFQSFVQLDGSTSRKRGGTGLGLAISQRMAKLMGGTISATSELHKGSSFTLTLPLLLPPNARDQEAKFSKEHFLVVHANQVVRDALVDMVHSLGGTTTAVADPEHIPSGLENFTSVLFPSVHLDNYGAALVERARLSKSAWPKLFIVRDISFTDGDDARQQLAQGFAAVVTLPFRRSQLLSAVDNRENMTAGRSSRGLILVAEDHPVNQEVTQLYLRELGFAADIVPDGASAIESITNSSRAYALVLMDCQMPGVDGYEATRAIREWERAAGSHTPIIAMTAHTMEGDRERCLAVGMDDYISKPIYPESLQRIVDKWINRTEAQKTAGPLYCPLDVDVATKRYGLNGLKKLLALYMDDIPGRCASIERAIATRNSAELTALTHAMTGASATIIAIRLKALCIELEVLANRQQWADIDDAYAAVKKELHCLSEFTESFVK